MIRLYIKKHNLIYLAMLLNICLQSCISDNLDANDINLSTKRAQLQIEINKTTTQNKLRYESQVESVRLLMFDSKSEKCVVNQKLEIGGNADLKLVQNKLNLQFDYIKVLPGLYDIVLLANENSSISDLSKYRAALDLVKTKIDLIRTDLMKIPYKYEGSKVYSAPEGPLLMSAYIKKVKIDSGSTEKPYKLKASLMSAMSLIEIVLKNEKENGKLSFTDKRVSKITLKNMLGHYSNPAIVDTSIDQTSFVDLTTDVYIDESNYQRENIESFRFYVPEVIKKESEGDSGKHAAVEISGNGFESKVFQLKNDMSVFLADLKNQQRLLNDDIVDLNSKRKYTSNFLRNYIYRIGVVLSGTTHQITASVEVLPWDVEESNRSYKEAEVSFNFNQGLLDKNTHTINAKGQSSITFTLNLKEPQGAPWRVSLTNGLDFEIKPHSTNETGVIGAIKGIVNKNTTYKFDVVPLRPFTGLPRYTELILVVDGKEEQLIPSLKDKNIASGPHNRYKIKQIE